ncbi:hypothetical protein SAMN05444397_10371 [Flavobacterium aquidurense]|nr:hypothetical protein SAMN05444397_10371 [Flavobacterium aquidurense]
MYIRLVCHSSFLGMTRLRYNSSEVASFLAMTYFVVTSLCGVTCGDSSFLGMTRLRYNYSEVASFLAMTYFVVTSL